jgi:hypothetical protein
MNETPRASNARYRMFIHAGKPGRRRITMHECADLATCVALWKERRNVYDLTSQDLHQVVVDSLETGKPVAQIAYNGRAFDMSGNEIAIGGAR